MALWTPYIDTPLDLSISSSVSPRTSFDYQHTEVHRPVPVYQHQTWTTLTPPPISSPESASSSRVYDSEEAEWAQYERDALAAMSEKSGGALLTHNPNMRRGFESRMALGDDGYRKQRERNNQAAKASRDRRKLREVRLAVEASFLEKRLRQLRRARDLRLCRNCVNNSERSVNVNL